MILLLRKKISLGRSRVGNKSFKLFSCKEEAKPAKEREITQKNENPSQNTTSQQ